MSATIQPAVVFGLRALESTEAALQHTVAEAATGKAVATVAENPPAFVVANSLASESSAWLTVGTRLAAAEVPTRVANAAVGDTSGILMKLSQSVIEMQAGGAQASQVSTQIQAYLSQIANNQQDATVNGVNLVAGAVGGDVTNTQISVPANPEARSITLGAKSLTSMSASVPGLGLATLNGTTDGACLDFSSLSPENISTSAPPTQVVIQTYNYANGNPETGQDAGQQWTFEFTDAANLPSSTTTPEAWDANGNVIQASHVVPVPLQPGFTVQDAMNALQTAMNGVYFDTKYSSSPPALYMAGNNVGLNDAVQNLRPSHPIPVVPYDYNNPSVTVGPGATTTFGITGHLPPGVSLAWLQGAPFLTTAAAAAAYEASDPTAPAVCLNPSLSPAPFSSGLTVTANPTGPAPGFSFTVPQAFTGTLPLPPGTKFEILVPQPATPTATPTVWGGAEGGLATVNSAMQKANDIAQNLGNSLNTLQAAQDHASQSIDVLNAGIGNLVDADMGNVAAEMQALQIRQQLATQSLSLGNQWPKLLVQLFQAPGSS